RPPPPRERKPLAGLAAAALGRAAHGPRHRRDRSADRLSARRLRRRTAPDGIARGLVADAREPPSPPSSDRDRDRLRSSLPGREPPAAQRHESAPAAGPG